MSNNINTTDTLYFENCSLDIGPGFSMHDCKNKVSIDSYINKDANIKTSNLHGHFYNNSYNTNEGRQINFRKAVRNRNLHVNVNVFEDFLVENCTSYYGYMYIYGVFLNMEGAKFLNNKFSRALDIQQYYGGGANLENCIFKYNECDK